MTTEQLEELQMLAKLPNDSPTATILAHLDRRVLVANKLVEALDWYIEVLQNNNQDITSLQAIKALIANREARK